MRTTFSLMMLLFKHNCLSMVSSWLVNEYVNWGLWKHLAPHYSHANTIQMTAETTEQKQIQIYFTKPSSVASVLMLQRLLWQKASVYSNTLRNMYSYSQKTCCTVEIPAVNPSLLWKPSDYETHGQNGTATSHNHYFLQVWQINCTYMS